MVRNQLIARGIREAAALRVFRRVPRHAFVAPGMRDMAYDDRALPTEKGQTISQPYMVGLMTEALQAHGAEKVLEVGTGSGYQTAVLAELARHVYSIERVPSLATAAAGALGELGYTNISFRQGDGSLGWQEEAPFDRIMVTAASPAVPPPLAEQLAEGGRMVIPIGPQSSQDLTLVTKSGGRLHHTSLCSCIFVKLIGIAGWKPE